MYLVNPPEREREREVTQKITAHVLACMFLPAEKVSLEK